MSKRIVYLNSKEQDNKNNKSLVMIINFRRRHIIEKVNRFNYLGISISNSKQESAKNGKG